MGKYKIINHSLGLGKCLILKSTWQPFYANVIKDEDISILRLSSSAGWLDTDLSFLKSLDNLKGVEVYNWDVHDLTPLYNIYGLETLSIDATLKKQIDLSVFPNLKVFMCTNSPKIKNLEKCKKLEYINISNYPYDSFNEISELKKLKRIFISSRKLSSFNGISSFQFLEKLDLYNCPQLRSLEGIGKASNLREVEITSCKKISDISPLRRLHEMSRLLIENGGPIESIRCLKECKKLEALFVIGDKPIIDGDLTVVKELPKLKKTSFAKKRHYNLTREQISQILSEK